MIRVFRIIDHLVEVSLHDLARDGREIGLHVGKRVGESREHVARDALHHLLEERSRALQNCADELGARGLAGAFKLIARLAGEIERFRIAHRACEDAAFVGVRHLEEVVAQNLLEETDLARDGRVGRSAVHDVVERLGLQFLLDLAGGLVLVGIGRETACLVLHIAVDLECQVDKRLDLLAALL